MFRVGQKIVLDNKNARGMSAKIGATAIVVPNKKCIIGCPDCRNGHVYIKWIQNGLCKTQHDGCYASSLFRQARQYQQMFGFMLEPENL